MVYVLWTFAEITARSVRREASLPLYLLVVWYGTILFSVLDFQVYNWSIIHRNAALSYILLSLFVAGSVIRIQAAAMVRKYYRTDEILQAGLFSRIRHPYLLGLMLQLLGISLFFGSLGGVGVWVLIGMPLVIYKIKRDDEETRAEYEDTWEEHLKKTKKIIPSIW